MTDHRVNGQGVVYLKSSFLSFILFCLYQGCLNLALCVDCIKTNVSNYNSDLVVNGEGVFCITSKTTEGQKDGRKNVRI